MDNGNGIALPHTRPVECVYQNTFITSWTVFVGTEEMRLYYGRSNLAAPVHANSVPRRGKGTPVAFLFKLAGGFRNGFPPSLLPPYMGNTRNERVRLLFRRSNAP